MKTATTKKIPVSVLVQALGVAFVAGIPVLFVAFNQLRRACGDALFGSREHFCSADELRTWLLSLPGWSYWILAFAVITAVALVRRSLRRMAS